MLHLSIRRIRHKITLLCSAVLLAVLAGFGAGGSPAQETHAAAVFFPLNDVYASDLSGQGLIKSSTLSIFGPSQYTTFGDPYSPLTDNGQPNPYYSELNGNYTFRIAIPPDYPYNKVRVELFDPDTGNPNAANSATVTNLSGTANTVACGIDYAYQYQSCLLPITNSITPNPDPFWFLRVDESRLPLLAPSTYAAAYPYHTTTLFRLYYTEPASNGDLLPVDLAYYTGKPDLGVAGSEARLTDLMWVSPGAPSDERMPTFPIPPPNAVPSLPSSAEPATTVDPCADYIQGGSQYDLNISQATECQGNGDFIVDLTSETPNMVVDPNAGIRYLYLQVRTLSGASENNFAVWAGPPVSEEPLTLAPSNINARQNFLANSWLSYQQLFHWSHGIMIYGMGHIPMNSEIQAVADIPLAYVSPEFAGHTVSVRMFDTDTTATPPLIFWVDSIPKATWQACFGGSSQCPAQFYGGTAAIPLNDAWTTYSFQLPTSFTGGNLYATYQAGMVDTFNWDVSVDGAPALAYPANGEVVADTAEIAREPFSGASTTQLQIDDNSNFTSPAFDELTTSLGATPPDQTSGTYYWRARGKDVLGHYTDWSSQRTIIVRNEQPDAPSQFKATVVSQTQVDLSWSKGNSPADGFRLERSDHGTDGWGAISTLGKDAGGYSDQSVSCGQTWYYRLLAFNKYGDSPAAGPVSAATTTCKPSAPGGLSATAVSYSEIDLTWADATNDYTGFKIQRSTDGGSTWDVTIPVGASPLSYHDTGMNCGITYTYQVIATNAGGDSTPSGMASATTTTCGPPASAPSGLSATAVSYSEIDLNWADATNDYTGFKIQRSTDGGSTWDVTIPVGASPLSYQDTGMNCGITYTYQVIATNAGGESTPSGMASATTTCDPAASLTPASRNFGAVQTGMSSGVFYFTLKNTGSAPLHVNGGLTQTGSAEFVLRVDECGGQTVDVGAACTFGVAFIPTVSGAVTGAISIADDAPGSPQQVTFSGVGAAAGAAPTLIAPKNGGVVYTPKVSLSWKAMAGAKGYRVQSDRDQGFQTSREANTTGTTYTLGLSGFGTYYWRVATKKALGQTEYSPAFSFEYTLNKTPAKGAHLKNGWVNFTWAALSGKKYKLEVYQLTSADPPDKTVVLHPPVQTRTSYAMSTRNKPLPKGTYYWHVSVDGGKTWTNPWTFFVP